MKSTIHIPIQQRGERGGGLLFPSLKIENKCPDFAKKNILIVFIYGLNFSFKMLFYKYIGEKSPNIPCGAFLSCVLYEMFIEVFLLPEFCPALKNYWLRPCSKMCDMIRINSVRVILFKLTNIGSGIVATRRSNIPLCCHNFSKE